MDDASAFFRICIDIGRINYEKNDLAIARRFLTTGVKGGERALIAYDLLNGYCSLFEIAQIDRDASRTEQIIVDMENLARASGYSKPILERIDAMKARLAIRKRDLHYCRRWLASQDLDQGYPFYKLFEAETAIRTLVILKEHSQAIQLSEKVLEIVNQNQSLRDIVRFRSWLALIYYQSGNFQTALRVLQKAVRISAHQKYIRSILDVGAPIIDLLEELDHHPPPEWSSKPILDHLSVLIYDQKYQTEISYNDTTLFYGENLLEPLTDRENEVLGLLSKGHSNTDISEIMVISESTVKYHLKNIYLKLGVHNRTQAIVKAAEFHLLM
jgi:LuxR family maltose regulon positive regulatory protein